ncbi:MAG: haloacid dehalogenase [Lysobacteraceae bacterium]|nr:MAG: haloacid dehalogenase [Xanthomonadaceae bacterium]
MTDAAVSASRPLVVFDFDHTLYDGDSGAHLVSWLLKRRRWRKALALLATPLLLPLLAWLPTRRHGISGYLWIGTVGDTRPFERLIDAYVAANAPSIRARLLSPALAVLHGHRVAGDEVVVATGAPPELARAILDFVAHQDLPVVGSLGRRMLGGYVTDQHCHAGNKMRMLRARGYGAVEVAYSDSSADLPLLRAARKPVVVNPKPRRVEMFRRVLPPGTPILNWGCSSRAGDQRVP